MTKKWMKRRKQFIESKVFFVLIVVVAAFLSAFLGQLFINLSTNTPTLLTEPNTIIREDSLHSSLREVVKRFNQQGRTSFVRVYDANNNLSGDGVILTSDGWVVTFQESKDKPAFIEIKNLGLLAVTEVVTDKFSELTFVKIETSALEAIKLAHSSSLENLEPLVILGYGNSAKLTYYSGTGYRDNDYYQSSQQNNFLLTDTGELGSAVFNKNSELVGIIISEQNGLKMLASVESISDSLNMLLRTGEISRENLNILYQGLSWHPNDSELQSGAIVSVPGLSRSLVIPVNSVAAIGGVKYGDVIVSVDGEKLEKGKTLSDVIAAQDVNKPIKLQVLRGSKELIIELNAQN